MLAAQDAAEGLTDEDSIPDLSEAPISESGDLWILGDHKLLVGDVTHDDDVARLMAGAVADLVFTDPPYNVDYEGYTEDRLKIKGDRMSERGVQAVPGSRISLVQDGCEAGASLIRLPLVILAT